jgi:hypothetical protein
LECIIGGDRTEEGEGRGMMVVVVMVAVRIREGIKGGLSLRDKTQVSPCDSNGILLLSQLENVLLPRNILLVTHSETVPQSEKVLLPQPGRLPARGGDGRGALP